MRLDRFPRKFSDVPPRARWIAALTLYVALALPLAGRAARLRARVPVLEKQVAGMRGNLQEISRLRDSGLAAGASESASLGDIERSADAVGLRTALSALTQNGSDGVVATFEGASLNRLVAWMNDLRLQTGLRVVSATMEPGSVPGVVNARMALR